MSSEQTILQVRNLMRRFSGVRAVDDISFDVSRATITGLIGPNGSGKSTTIDCISGFQRPDEGRVLLEGEEITGLQPHAIARKGLTRTFQTVRVYDELTLVDHLLIGNQEFDGVGWWEALLRGRRLQTVEESTRRRALELLEMVGLGQCANWPAGVLSYGQRKLLALAAALIAKPRIVLLDEPLAGVNPTMINQIGDAIRAVNAQGQTFLIVEHDVNFITSICHHAVVLESGKMLVEGPPRLIHEDSRVLEAYLGQPIASGGVDGV